ncbi:hypothetical protein FGB62_17g458 [Gracilaria domingensis]|nr:hypothetical protein FGB62_17g458 [Gracilaria domingensis]
MFDGTVKQNALGGHARVVLGLPQIGHELNGQLERASELRIGGHEVDVKGGLGGKVCGEQGLPELDEAVGGGGGLELLVEPEQNADMGRRLAHDEHVLAAGEKVIVGGVVVLGELEGLGGELGIRAGDGGERAGDLGLVVDGRLRRQVRRVGGGLRARLQQQRVVGGGVRGREDEVGERVPVGRRLGGDGELCGGGGGGIGRIEGHPGGGDGAGDAARARAPRAGGRRAAGRRLWCGGGAWHSRQQFGARSQSKGRRTAARARATRRQREKGALQALLSKTAARAPSFDDQRQPEPVVGLLVADHVEVRADGERRVPADVLDVAHRERPHRRDLRLERCVAVHLVPGAHRQLLGVLDAVVHELGRHRKVTVPDVRVRELGLLPLVHEHDGGLVLLAARVVDDGVHARHLLRVDVQRALHAGRDAVHADGHGRRDLGLSQRVGLGHQRQVRVNVLGRGQDGLPGPQHAQHVELEPLDARVLQLHLLRQHAAGEQLGGHGGAGQVVLTAEIAGKRVDLLLNVLGLAFLLRDGYDLGGGIELAGGGMKSSLSNSAARAAAIAGAQRGQYARTRTDAAKTDRRRGGVEQRTLGGLAKILVELDHDKGQIAKRRRRNRQAGRRGWKGGRGGAGAERAAAAMDGWRREMRRGERWRGSGGRGRLGGHDAARAPGVALGAPRPVDGARAVQRGAVQRCCLSWRQPAHARASRLALLACTRVPRVRRGHAGRVCDCAI